MEPFPAFAQSTPKNFSGVGEVAANLVIMKLRASAPTIEAPQPEPSTIAEIEAALSKLDNEREATLQALAALPARERELIEANADEAQLTELDLSKRRAERALTRAEVIQQRLLSRAAEIQAANRASKWAELKVAYIAAASEFIAAQKEAMRCRERVEAICKEARGLSSTLSNAADGFRSSYSKRL